MKYNFNEIISRDNTYTLKWDKKILGEKYNFDIHDDTLYLWVADMDFYCAPQIVSAIEDVAKTKIYGYVVYPEELRTAIINWYSRRHNMKINKDWIVYSSGVMNALDKYINIFTNVEDGVIVQPPVYSPFSGTIKKANRRVVNNYLIYENGKYSIDFENFEELCKKPENKMFVFCNPHNPCGKIWPREDVERLVNICEENGILIFADEIHCDIRRLGSKFTSMLNVSSYEGIVVATAINKVFNTAGLHASNLIIPSDQMRQKYKQQVGVVLPTSFAVAAMIAAYNECEDWCNELNEYLDKTYNFIDIFIKENLGNLDFSRPDGTYFVWLDFNKYNIDSNTLVQKLGEEAHICVENGAAYGETGEGFIRMNIASPLCVIQDALNRIKMLIDSL